MNRREISSWVGVRRRIASLLEELILRYGKRHLEPENAESGPSVSDLRRALRALPRRMPAVDLTTRLRVLGSHESQRRRKGATWSAKWSTGKQKFRLWADNLMRPIAIPTAGGCVSALLLFGILAPSLAIPTVHARSNDIPTVLYTNASVKNFMAIGFEGNNDVVVEITVDEHGKLVDYTFPNCEDQKTHMHQAIENQILFTEFTPATRLGQPMPGKLKITFLSSRIDVKG